MGVTFAGMKHDLSSVKTSDSSLGTPAQMRTPPLKQQHNLITQHQNIWPNYYPIPSGAAMNSNGANNMLVPPPSFTASTTASSAATPMKNGRMMNNKKFPSAVSPFGASMVSSNGSRMYHQVGQQQGSMSEEAYEELDFIRRSPGVGEEGMVRHLPECSNNLLLFEKSIKLQNIVILS